MMSALLVAATAAVLAGLGAIAYGIPIKEFSVGGTIILCGALGVSTGMIMFGLAAVLAELKLVAHRLRLQVPGEAGSALLLPEDMPGAELDVPVAPPMDELLESGNRGRGRARLPGARLSAPEPEPELEPEPDQKPKRNLLFSSNLRRDREQEEERSAELPTSRLRAGASSEPPADEPAPPSAPLFGGDRWPPRGERSRPREPVAPPPPLSPLPRRPLRAAAPEPAPVRGNDPPEVSVIKSGVVDGMAYSLYSDGSIEAQLPEGMMRFASISELRDHLDQRT